MSCMDTSSARAGTGPSTRHPREIAAAVTLPVAARALVAPGGPTVRPAAAQAVITTCAALAPRIALLAFVGQRGRADPDGIRAFDPFRDTVPPVMRGTGPEPDRSRVRTAGDRCVDAWRWWVNTPDTAVSTLGVAGVLATAAWCSWALGSELRAVTRARYALEVRADDPLAALVLRTCRAGARPRWSG
jgi:hypothetical protein